MSNLADEKVFESVDTTEPVKNMSQPATKKPRLHSSDSLERGASELGGESGTTSSDTIEQEMQSTIQTKQQELEEREKLLEQRERGLDKLQKGLEDFANRVEKNRLQLEELDKSIEEGGKELEEFATRLRKREQLVVKNEILADVLEAQLKSFEENGWELEWNELLAWMDAKAAKNKEDFQKLPRDA